jgi:biopolymer transport protein ExbD
MRTPSKFYAIEESGGIDLAPMLDFVVNLLIFFIVTAVFVRQSGVEVGRPSRVTSQSDGSSKSIVIDRDGTISIDARTVDLRAVRAHIQQFRATTTEGHALIVAHERAPTGAIVAAIDEIHLGGIWDITFTTDAIAN